MTADTAHLVYIAQTLAWMGCDTRWRAEVIAEQLGDFNDPRVLRDLDQAVAAGLVSENSSGYCLTESGFELASSEINA